MRQSRLAIGSAGCVLISVVTTLMLSRSLGNAQAAVYERAFAQPKAAVEKTIQQLQSSTSGRLPVLDGFARPGDHPFDRFQRGYYQCTTQVSSTPDGGSLVRVSARITAWYADPAASKSGYEVLPSNGRLETDLLDRIEEALSGKGSPSASQPKSHLTAPPLALTVPQPGDTVPVRSITSSKPETSSGSLFTLKNPVSSDQGASLATQKAVADKRMEELNKEARNLAEILRNQAHPDNLVAVKKSSTPVLVSPIEGAKVLFLAAAEDEFEILDMNANWVHIRISGLSRGWIRRSSVELPETVASHVQTGNPPPSSSADKFQVKDEQTATFPGTWEPLRGQTVKILTVQKTTANASDTGPQAKLDFTRSLFEKVYTELTQTPTSAAGVVLIFDSEDGGMAAATLPALEQWKAGTLSDQAFWRRCFFDPPETFRSQDNH